MILWPLGFITLPATLLGLLVLLLIAGPLTLAHLVAARIRGRALSSRLRRVGRTIGWEEVSEEMSRGPGVFFLQYTTLGWNETHLWWALEDCRALATAAGLTWVGETQSTERIGRQPFSDVEFQRWCEARYLALDAGRARLIAIVYSSRQRHRLESRVKAACRQNPGVDIVRVFSAQLRMMKLKPEEA